MPQITIAPVSRIEGHATIRLVVDDAGEVRDARFQVTQVRGFEQFVVGRPFFEMPALTARICGICPVSHALASAKAGDQLLAVALPATAGKLRSLLNLAQLIQSHALSYFYLSAPDLLLGMEYPPESRNFFGLFDSDPQCARDGIRIRRFGQQTIERLAGRRIHPTWVVPGGVNAPLTSANREEILAELPAVKALVRTHLDRWKQALDHHLEHIAFFANFPSLFLGLVNDQGTLEHDQGSLRLIDAQGVPVGEDCPPHAYQRIIGEAVEPWTYLKFPYFRPLGYPEGLYRVGPLARLNLASRCGAELADQELVLFRKLATGPVLSHFHSHYARLIETLFAVERIEQLLADPGILDQRVRAVAGVNCLEGVGVIEAPRGTLIHHYWVNDDGLIQKVNLIIATGHNNLAMQRGILQAARHFLNGATLHEGLLNRIEAVIRTFDPCLSCSTHVVGRMPLVVELLAADGTLLDRRQR